MSSEKWQPLCLSHTELRNLLQSPDMRSGAHFGHIKTCTMIQVQDISMWRGNGHKITLSPQWDYGTYNGTMATNRNLPPQWRHSNLVTRQCFLTILLVNASLLTLDYCTMEGIYLPVVCHTDHHAKIIIDPQLDYYNGTTAPQQKFTSTI